MRRTDASLLRTRNGGHLSGVALPASHDGDEVVEVFCIGGKPEGLIEALSLKTALVDQGLDERLSPFARTTLNRLLLVETGDDRILLLDADGDLEAVEPLTDSTAVVEKLQHAFQRDDS